MKIHIKICFAAMMMITVSWKSQQHGVVAAVDSWDEHQSAAVAGYPAWNPQSHAGGLAVSSRRQLQDPARQAFLSLILQPAGLLLLTLAGVRSEKQKSPIAQAMISLCFQTVSNAFLTVSRTVENAENNSDLSSRVDTVSTKLNTLETTVSTLSTTSSASGTTSAATCAKVFHSEQGDIFIVL